MLKNSILNWASKLNLICGIFFSSNFHLMSLFIELLKKDSRPVDISQFETSVILSIKYLIFAPPKTPIWGLTAPSKPQLYLLNPRKLNLYHKTVLILRISPWVVLYTRIAQRVTHTTNVYIVVTYLVIMLQSLLVYCRG